MSDTDTDTDTDSNTERYPLDLDAIQKGQVIDRERLAAILGECDDYTFQYRLAGFSQDLQRSLWNHDKPFTVRIKDFTLEILDDATAAEYNREQFHKGLRKLAKSHRQLMAVDPESLDDDQRKALRRSLVVQGAILAGIATSRETVRAIAHQRATPAGLPGIG